MTSILSRYIPADSPVLRKEFEITYAEEFDALYQRFLATKAREHLETNHPAVLATPVEQLSLPSRTVTALKRKGFDTVADLIDLTEEDLAKGPGLSRDTAHIALEAVNSLITPDPKR